MNNKKASHSSLRNKWQDSFYPKVSLGQNFILDDALLEKLTELSGLSGEENILEIGTGSGSFTKHLASRCRKLITVEIDDTLIPILRVTLEPFENVQLIHGNILSMDLQTLLEELPECHVVANIPYYLTTELINKLLDYSDRLHSITMMVQKEAADRILAEPGDDAYGILAVRCAWKGRGERLLEVPSSAFIPPPKVDSSFVRVTLYKEPPIHDVDEKQLMRVANAAFMMRRKTYENNISGAFHIEKEKAAALLEACGIQKGVRGEALGLSAFARVAEKIREYQALSE